MFGSVFVVNRSPSRACPTAQSIGDDTRAVGTWLTGHQISPQCYVVHSVRGLRAWSIDGCSHKDAGRSERKTPTLASVNRLTPKHQTSGHYTELFNATLFNTIPNEPTEYDTSQEHSRNTFL